MIQRIYGTVQDRLMAHSERDVETGCLRYVGQHTDGGYGLINIDGTPRRAHRVAYELWVGPIPVGLTLDHVYAWGCRYKDCIEPSHLEPVTLLENNTRRGEIVTHCPRGHEYTEANTYVRKGRNGKHCKTCANERRRAGR